MKNLNRFIGMALVATLFSASGAWAGPMFSLFGAGQKILNTTEGVTYKIGFGGGASIGFMLGQKASLDIGAIYLSRKTDISVLGIDVSATTAGLNIPVAFQFWLGKGVALELGGYYELSLETGGSSDYGALGGLRFEFGNATKFFINPRFEYGLKSTPASNEVLLLVGVAFGGKK